MRNSLPVGLIIGGLSLSIALLNIESPKQPDYSGGYTSSAKIKATYNPINDEGHNDSLSIYPLSFETQPKTSHPEQAPAHKVDEFSTAAFAYNFGEASISGVAGALSQETELTISGLETRELPPLEQGMVNVTGDYAAYRMLPHGTRFNSDIDIVLPYDTALLPIGYTPADIMTWYYSETRHQWVMIPRDTVDEASHLVYSKVNHFTDFINAIIKSPEMPETQAYTPTSIKDLKAANPLEGINLIQPPTANNNGTANLSYPIDIPAGRQGMQPNLAVTYNSSGGNGWLGVGWDLSVPSITVETRWGVPRYDASQESEVYLYQGEQMVNKDGNGRHKPLRHRTNGNLTRLNGDVRFYPRVEEAFDSIVRHGNSPKNYWWSVTDRNGITNFYGKSHSSNSVDPSSVLTDGDGLNNTGRIAHWALTETRDPYGNRVLYYYNTVYDYSNNNNQGNRGKQIYLSRINYTADSTGEGKYNIYFNLRETDRKDITVSGRYGFKEVTSKLLCHIKINYTTETLFAYLFITENRRESQFKSRLRDIYLYDSIAVNHDGLAYCNSDNLTSDEEFFLTRGHIRYHFDYYDYPAAGALFGSAVSNSSLPNDGIKASFITSAFTNGAEGKATVLGATKGKSWSLGGTASAGLGPVVCLTSISVGGNFNYSESSSEGLLTMLDMDGDGLADKVFKKGNNVYYRKQQQSADGSIAFGPDKLLTGITRFLEESSSNTDWGLQASAGLSLSGAWPSSTSTTSVYFADVNGDGLPDLIDDTRVLFNSLNANGVPYFTPFQPAPQSTDGSGAGGGSSSIVVTSATQPCGDIIFDGSVSDSLICVNRWVYIGTCGGTCGYVNWHDYLQQRGLDMESGNYQFEIVDCQHVSDEFYQYISNHTLFSSNYTEPPAGMQPHCISNQGSYGRYQGVFVYKKEVDCHHYVKNDPDLDAVKVWVAPYEGDVNIYSVLNLMQDTSTASQQSAFSDGISYSIQHEGGVARLANSQSYYLTSETSNELARNSVYRSDYSTHYDTVFNRHVHAGDLVFFRLMSNGNRNFDKVIWRQQVAYTSRGSNLDIFGKPENRYASDEDFVVTGKDYFVACKPGQVKISGVGYVGNFKDNNGVACNARLLIKHNNTSHYFTLVRNGTTPINLSLNVSGNDSIKYSLISSTGHSGSWGDVEVAPRLDFIAHLSTDASGNAVGTPDTVTYYLPVNMNIGGEWNFWVVLRQPGACLVNCANTFATLIDFSRYHTYSKLFGDLYRGWGNFAYNNQGNSGDSPIMLNTLKIPRVLVYENSSDFSEEDTSQFYLDSNSMEMGNSESMSAGFSGVYAPVSVSSNWVQSFPKPQFWAYAGYGNINYINRRIMTNTRLPELITGSAGGTGTITIYDSPVPVPDVNAQGVPMEVKTVRKQNESKLKNWSLSASLGPANMGTSHSNGENVTLADYIDMNGDRYPDQVGRSRIQYTNPWGGIGTEIDINCTDAQQIGLTSTSSLGANFGASYSLPKKNTSNAPRNSKTSFDGQGSIGASLGGGTDYAAFNYMDVNADGLPDRVFKQEDGTVKVALNMGYWFLPSEPWDLGNEEIRSGESSNSSLSLGGNFNISQASIGGGVSISTSENKTSRSLMDINGDGLPDRVKKSGSSLSVSYNLGNGSWSAYETLSGIGDLSHGTSFSESANASVTVGFTLFAILKITVGISGAPYNRTFSKDRVQLVDFNNDGYVDCVTSNAESNISVRYNQAAQTNLLRQVTNFTGSKIALRYQLPESSYEQPQRSWVLSEVYTSDEYSPAGATSTHTAIEYCHPHYDRHERMAYGYDSLVIRQYDTKNNNALYRYTVEEYNNTNFLKRGKKTRDILCDAQNNPWIEHIYEVQLADLTDGSLVGDSACPSEAFPRYESIITNYYEGQATPKITTAISREYDMKRNVVIYINYGDRATEDEYLKATITYKASAGHNLISLPEVITVANAGGNMLRKRQAGYNNKGKATQIRQYYTETDFAQTDLAYDSYGNVIQITLPPNANSQRMYYQYAYDPVLHALPVSVTNALEHVSTTEYIYKWGKPVKAKDINGSEMRYRYDRRGRLARITAPNEISPGAGYTVSMQYPEGLHTNYFFSSAYPAFGGGGYLPNSATCARTEHYDPQHPDNPIVTATFCDGWGRVIQVNRDVEAGGMEQMQISGRAEWDAFGRTVKQYYPVLATAGLYYYVSEYDTQIPPTCTTYDILDRPLTITDPLGNVTAHAYGFGNDSTSKRRFTTITTDANGNSTTAFAKSRGEQTQISAPLNTVTQFYHNELGELLASYDPEGFTTKYEYDLLGRCISRNHPDAGKDRYKFDPAGNLVARQTQKLYNNGDTIYYIYDYNQLISILYPEHPENNVYYKYGSPYESTSIADKAVGRIIWQEDAAGFQQFSYDPLGNVSKNIRTFALPNLWHHDYDAQYTFTMYYSYDSWGRITYMGYPDGEKTGYSYNHAGDLYAMTGNKWNSIIGDEEHFRYIDSIKYNKYGQRSQIWYGNGTYASYQYDNLQRLQYLNSYTVNNEAMQSITYTYDSVSNITGISNAAPPLNNGLGGIYSNAYQYDNLYRLVYAASSGSNGMNYGLNMTYSPNGKILQKKNTYYNTYNGNVNSSIYQNDYYYTTGSSRLAYINTNGSSYAQGFSWDANGNMAARGNSYESRSHLWDEENRLKAIETYNNVGYYGYDASGERAYKLTVAVGRANYNGYSYAYSNITGYTLYPSPYLVATTNQYTKHYYAGTERVVSKIGGGGLSDLISNSDNKYKEMQATAAYESIFQQFAEPYTDIRDDFDLAKFNEEMRYYQTLETDLYFYHPDHLSSASWITDSGGLPIQHLQYMPFGETRVDQRTTGSNWNTRYSFSAKEMDEESRYHYFGARYYDSDLSIFLSVDPQSASHPSTNNYMYCLGNPLRLVDPNGEDEWEVNESGKFTKTKECTGNDVIKSTRLGVRKQELSGNGVLRAAFSEKKDDKGNVMEQSFKGLSKRDAQSTFGIAAKSSSNEWGYMETKDASGNTNTLIGTDFNPDGETFVYPKAFDAEAGSLVRYDHSHPCTESNYAGGRPSSEGTGASNQYDDIGAWKALLQKHPSASMGIRHGKSYNPHVQNGVPNTSDTRERW